VTLRRRLVLVFVAYLALAAVSAGSAFWVASQRDDEIARLDAIVAQGDLSGAQQEEFEAANDRLDDLRDQLHLVIGGALIASIVLTFWAALLVRRSVTRPVDRISDAVRRVRRGDRHTSVPATGPIELARLGADVEDLRRQLNLEILEAVRSREALEARATVVLSLRSQLEPEVEELPPEWTVAAQVEPAEGIVAGDCYDIVRLSPTMLGFVVVDISGHGAVSGILALRCQDMLRAALRNGLEPGDSIQWASEQIDDLGDETFLSAFVGVADLVSGEIRYANAGHPPAILCTTKEAVQLSPTGPIVGLSVGAWSTARATVAAGDTLAIYTDGLVEVRDEQGIAFGLERLVGVVCGSVSDDADAIAKRCLDEISDFAPDRLRDDATVVLLCRGPRTERRKVKLRT
jgi:serine phosphatase RsbU (regulator of sigma subunit)